MANRIGRDVQRVTWAYHELFEGNRPSLPGLQPAPFLPVAAIDYVHDDDPVVILPGTFVGRLSGAAIGSFPAAQLAGRPLVPSCPNTYKLKYSAWDYATAFWGGTPDIDGDGTTFPSDANSSTQSVEVCPPIGLVPQPVYSPVLGSRFTNYDRNMEVTQILCQNQVVLIPAITANEQTIDIGDKVCIDFAATTDDYSPAAGLVTSLPGRLASVTNQITTIVPGALEANIETALSELSDFTVGRCLDRFKISGGTTTQNLTYRAGLAAGTVDPDEANQMWNFHTMRLVQTVPGLGLPGSGTEGVPGYLTYATADASGDFWGLAIQIDVS